MQKIFDFISWPWRQWQEKKRMKKRLEELRKRDPFIYK